MPFLERDGVKLYYEEAGSGSPPIVFVHGWCCDHTYFAPQFEHFRANHRAIAVDLRGHGQSDKPEQEYTASAFADDVAWLCRQLGADKPVVVGHSMGGVVALVLAAEHPVVPSAIVIVDSPIVMPEALRSQVMPLVGALKSPQYREASQQFVSNALFIPADDPDRKAQIVEGMSAAPQHVMASAFEGIFTDLDPALQACQVPALNIMAAGPLCDAKRMSELCPRVVHGQTVGAGHFNQLEVPDQVNAMIERFLKISIPA